MKMRKKRLHFFHKLKQSQAEGFTAVFVDDYDKYLRIINTAIVTGKQIGRASCRERVSSPV